MCFGSTLWSTIWTYPENLKRKAPAPFQHSGLGRKWMNAVKRRSILYNNLDKPLGAPKPQIHCQFVCSNLITCKFVFYNKQWLNRVPQLFVSPVSESSHFKIHHRKNLSKSLRSLISSHRHNTSPHWNIFEWFVRREKTLTFKNNIITLWVKQFKIHFIF